MVNITMFRESFYIKDRNNNIIQLKYFNDSNIHTIYMNDGDLMLLLLKHRRN